MTLISFYAFKVKGIQLNCYTHKHEQGYKKRESEFTVQIFLFSILCFDGLELFLLYKLQYKEAAPDGNAVYFCSK